MHSRNRRNNLLAYKAVAKTLGITPPTLYKWRKKKLFPEPIKIGNRYYYHEEVLSNFFSFLEREKELRPFWWENTTIETKKVEQ